MKVARPKFARLFFPVVVAATLVASHAAHAQSDPAYKPIDEWADAIAKAAKDKIGAKRQDEIKSRTDKLNKDMASVKCNGLAHAEAMAGHVRKMKNDKDLRIETKGFFPRCDGGQLIDWTLSSKGNGWEAEDKTYDEAVFNNDSMTNFVSGWGYEVKRAIDKAGESPAAARKAAEAATENWIKTMNVRTCVPQIKYDLKPRLEQELKTRQVSMDYHAGMGCGADGKWVAWINIHSVAPTIDTSKFSSWTEVTRDMFPDAQNFTTDAQKQAWADKFKSDGDYIKKLDTILCEESLNTVAFIKRELAKKAQALKDVFKFGQPSLSCLDSHLKSAMTVEVIKTAPKKK